MKYLWFRFYSEALNDPKVQSLPPDLFKHWVNILCLACNNNGTLPETLHETAFALRLSETDAQTVLERLLNATLIDRISGGANGYRYAPHGWDKRQYKSDTSTDRVKRFRNRKVNVTETPPDTDTDTDTDNTTYLSKTDFQKVFEFGYGLFPNLMSANTSEIHKWLQAGCSIEHDIIPEIQKAQGKNINTWRYFTNAIMDAKATRESPLPVGQAKRGFQSPAPPKKRSAYRTTLM